jgi:transaldolase
MTKTIADLNVKVFADGADLPGMLELHGKPYVKGFTTNPTLMRQAGITDYRAFARLVVEAIPDRPISFEVFSDEFAEMERQAREIAGWGPNVYVKVPVTNTRREPSYELVERLSQEGVRLNVTALLALDQVREVAARLEGGAPSCVSMFAGRIADGGGDSLHGAASRAHLGEPARAAQHLPCGRRRLPHHHRDARHPPEDPAHRPRSVRVLARHGEDVPSGRGRRRVHARVARGELHDRLTDARVP